MTWTLTSPVYFKQAQLQMYFMTLWPELKRLEVSLNNVSPSLTIITTYKGGLTDWLVHSALCLKHQLLLMENASVELFSCKHIRERRQKLHQCVSCMFRHTKRNHKGCLRLSVWSVALMLTAKIFLNETLTSFVGSKWVEAGPVCLCFK